MNPENGACTNTVEGVNSALKSGVIPQHRTSKHADAAIGTFVWRRVNKGRLCEAFLMALSFYVERNMD